MIPTSVVLETKTCNGGTETQKVDSNSIPSGGTTLVGKIVNDLGRDMEDLTITVTGDKAATGPPVKTPPSSSGGSTVSRPSGNGSVTGSNSTTASNDGFSTTVDFGQAGNGNVGPVGNGDTINVSIDIAGAGTASDINVKYTPSVGDKPKNSSLHADALQVAELTTGRPGVVLGLDAPGNDRASVYVTNEEKPGNASLVEISGDCGLPGGISLTNVYLQNPSINFNEPTGTSITITGNKFSITGFTPLPSSETYEVVCVFSGVPGDGYKVTIDGTFK